MIGQLLVLRMSDQVIEQCQHGISRKLSADDLGIQREPHEPGLRRQARGSPGRRVGRKPPARRRVMHMIAPRECEQDVHIRQRNQKPSPSIACRTVAGLTAGVPFGT